MRLNQHFVCLEFPSCVYSTVRLTCAVELTYGCAGVFVPQAPVRDRGVPGQVLPLHEDRRGRATQQHRLQAQRSSLA